MLALKKEISNNLTVYRRDVRLIGSQFEISVVGNDPIWAHERIDSAITEINRIEKLLSAFGDDSAINTINRNAGIQPVQVSGEIFRLIARSLKISELTYGAYDLTYYSADKLFIDADADNGNIYAIPYAVTNVNYKGVVMDAQNSTVFLKERGMRIGFAAISKGYAADRAKYVLQLDGVHSGVVNVDGNLLTWGLQPDMEPWTVAQAHPGHKAGGLANINISNLAITTLINTDAPLAIKKANSGFNISLTKSVSVISPSAEFADAMAKPLMAMGINAGLYLVNKLNQLGCVVIDDQNRTYTSKDIHIA